MDGLYLYTSSVKIFLVNPFSRVQKISKHVPLCTRAPRISKCFHPQQNDDDVTPNWRICEVFNMNFKTVAEKHAAFVTYEIKGKIEMR